MAFDATYPATEPSTSDNAIAPKIEDIEELEAAIDKKLNIDAPDAVFIADTCPALAPVKFEPEVALDPRQVPDSESEEDTFNARIAGFHLASMSSSSQSVASVDVLANMLGPAGTPQRRGRYKGSKNRRSDPVVDPGRNHRSFLAAKVFGRPQQYGPLVNSDLQTPIIV